MLRTQRHADPDFGAAAVRVVRGDRARVRLDDRFADREAKTESALRALRLRLVEFCEDVASSPGINPGP